MSGPPRTVVLRTLIVARELRHRIELDALKTAYANHAPLLLFFWLPHWAFNIYDLTKVDLPAYDDACYARAPVEGVDCDYPPERLTKIVWSGLKSYAPRAYDLVMAFSYSTLTQIKLMGRVKIDGLTVDEAAHEWVNQNEDTWRAWVMRRVWRACACARRARRVA